MDAQSGTQLDSTVVMGFYRLHEQGTIARIMQEYHAVDPVESEPYNIQL